MINVSEGHINSAQSSYRLNGDGGKHSTLAIDKHALTELIHFVSVIRDYEQADLETLYQMIRESE